MFGTKRVRKFVIGAVVAAVTAGGAVATTSIANVANADDAYPVSQGFTFDEPEVLVEGTVTFLSKEDAEVDITTTLRSESEVRMQFVGAETNIIHDHKLYNQSTPVEHHVIKLHANNPNGFLREINRVRVLATDLQWSLFKFADCYRDHCEYFDE